MIYNKAYKGLQGKKGMRLDKGFTLLELMIAMAIFGVVIAGVIGAYYEQLRSHNTQQQILEVHQNARAAMHYITRELRMAGYDPSGGSGAGLTPDAGVSATATFSMDITGGENDGIDNDDDGTTDEADEAIYGNGDTAADNEEITYALVNSQIMRTDQAGNAQILADNIDALDFVYHGIDPGDPTNTNFRFNAAGGAANPGNIRSVNVTIVARIERVMAISHKAQDDTTYRNLDGDMLFDMSGAPDNVRRIMLQKTVKLRNMGL